MMRPIVNSQTLYVVAVVFVTAPLFVTCVLPSDWATAVNLLCPSTGSLQVDVCSRVGEYYVLNCPQVALRMTVSINATINTDAQCAVRVVVASSVNGPIVVSDSSAPPLVTLKHIAFRFVSVSVQPLASEHHIVFGAAYAEDLTVTLVSCRVTLGKGSAGLMLLAVPSRLVDVVITDASEVLLWNADIVQTSVPRDSCRLTLYVANGSQLTANATSSLASLMPSSSSSSASLLESMTIVVSNRSRVDALNSSVGLHTSSVRLANVTTIVETSSLLNITSWAWLRLNSDAGVNNVSNISIFVRGKSLAAMSIDIKRDTGHIVYARVDSEIVNGFICVESNSELRMTRFMWAIGPSVHNVGLTLVALKARIVLTSSRMLMGVNQELVSPSVTLTDSVVELWESSALLALYGSVMKNARCMFHNSTILLSNNSNVLAGDGGMNVDTLTLLLDARSIMVVDGSVALRFNSALSTVRVELRGESRVLVDSRSTLMLGINTPSVVVLLHNATLAATGIVLSAAMMGTVEIVVESSRVAVDGDGRQAINSAFCTFALSTAQAVVTVEILDQSTVTVSSGATFLMCNAAYSSSINIASGSTVVIESATLLSAELHSSTIAVTQSHVLLRGTPLLQSSLFDAKRYSADTSIFMTDQSTMIAEGNATIVRLAPSVTRGSVMVAGSSLYVSGGACMFFAALSSPADSFDVSFTARLNSVVRVDSGDQLSAPGGGGWLLTVVTVPCYLSMTLSSVLGSEWSEMKLLSSSYQLPAAVLGRHVTVSPLVTTGSTVAVRGREAATTRAMTPTDVGHGWLACSSPDGGPSTPGNSGLVEIATEPLHGDTSKRTQSTLMSVLGSLQSVLRTLAPSPGALTSSFHAARLGRTLHLLCVDSKDLVGDTSSGSEATDSGGELLSSVLDNPTHLHIRVGADLTEYASGALVGNACFVVAVGLLCGVVDLARQVLPHVVAHIRRGRCGKNKELVTPDASSLSLLWTDSRDAAPRTFRNLGSLLGSPYIWMLQPSIAASIVVLSFGAPNRTPAVLYGLCFMVMWVAPLVYLSFRILRQFEWVAVSTYHSRTRPNSVVAACRWLLVRRWRWNPNSSLTYGKRHKAWKLCNVSTFFDLYRNACHWFFLVDYGANVILGGVVGIGYFTVYFVEGTAACKAMEWVLFGCVVACTLVTVVMAPYSAHFDLLTSLVAYVLSMASLLLAYNDYSEASDALNITQCCLSLIFTGMGLVLPAVIGLERGDENVMPSGGDDGLLHRLEGDLYHDNATLSNKKRNHRHPRPRLPDGGEAPHGSWNFLSLEQKLEALVALACTSRNPVAQAAN